jgi:hypothetical protein
LKLPTPNVLVMDLVRKGIPASARVYTVASDGRTLTETAAYAGGNGMPMMRTNYVHARAVADASGADPGIFPSVKYR